MLLIALVVIWLMLAAFVLTMCRLAARSDAARINRVSGGTSQPRRAPQTRLASRSAMPASRLPDRSGLRVE